jgi:hypothetical protein
LRLSLIFGRARTLGPARSFFRLPPTLLIFESVSEVLHFNLILIFACDVVGSQIVVAVTVARHAELPDRRIVTVTVASFFLEEQP